MNTTNINKQNNHLDLENEHVQKVLSLYDDHSEAPYISPNRDVGEWLDQVSIGSESLVPKRNTVRIDDDFLPGHIILLWRINFGTYTTDSVYPKYFEYDYGINAKQALDEVQAKGYARQQTPFESLPHQSAAQLKALLKSKNVKGLSKFKKAELMDKTRDVFAEDELGELFDLRGFELTESGEALLKKYQDVVDKHPKKKY
ncbi:MAG: hypothetical protein JJU16_01705 [Alkalibacterium sp.]|nr:hypothetical protein [Alkalibacterium sp.]